MSLSVFFLFFAFSAVLLDGHGAFGMPCLTGSNPSPQALTFCTEFASSSCCSVSDATRVSNSMTMFEEVYGPGPCLEHLRNFTCTFTCSPDHRLLARYQAGGAGVVTGYASAVFAEEWYQSCKNICITDEGDRIQDILWNAQDFVQSHDTENNPDYVPSFPLSPNVHHRVGPNPNAGTGGSYGGGPSSIPLEDNSDQCPDTTFWIANGASVPTSTSTTSTPATTGTGDQYCPLKFAEVPQPEILEFCPQYDSAACCTPELGDLELKLNTEEKVQPLYGNGNCYTNIKNFFCSWTCGPFQQEVMSVEGFGILNITVYADAALATSFFNSCRKVCLPFGGGRTVEQQFANGEEFLKQFESRNDPNYVPDATHPYLFYAIGTSPNGGNIDSTMVTILADDAEGCVDPEDSSASISSSALQLITLLVTSWMLFL